MGLSKKVKIKYEVDGASAKRGLDAMAKGTEKVRKGAKASATELAGTTRALGRGGRGLTGFLTSADKVGDGLRNTAAAVLAVKSAFESTADAAVKSQIALDNIPFSINKARGATRGFVDDLTLQQQAIAANRLGAAKTEEDFARLASAATKLGLSVGQDTTKSVQDLTTALARQSPRILDNLGILLTVGEANREYAKRLGKTADALTEAERKQAFMTIGLERAEEAAAKVNVELDQSASFALELKAQATNTGNYLARGFVGSLSNASKALENAIGFVTGLNSELDALDRAAGSGRSFFLEFGEQVLKRQESADARRAEAVNASELREIEAEMVTFERESFELDLRSLKLQIAGTTNQRELNKLLGKEAATKAALLELDGKGVAADKVLFDNLLRERRSNARGRRGGKRDPNKSERLEFQQQLTEALNAERAREFAQATSLQRNFLRDTVAFQNAMQTVQLASLDRSKVAAAEDERIAGLRDSRLQRDTELALAKAETDAQRFAIEQSVFSQREFALERQIELETQVGERQQLQDDLAQVRHERVLSRIERERQAREESAANTARVISIVGQVEQSSLQLSEAVAGASIKNAERQRAAMAGIQAGHLVFKGGVSIVEGGIAIAAGNYGQGIAQIGAGAAAIVRAGTLAASVGASVRGGGAGGGGGGPAPGSATQFGGGQTSAPTANFTVDRGAPISVRDDVEGNPNNTTTSSSSQQRSTGNVYVTAQILGAVDDESSNKIAKGIERARANLGT